MTARPFCPCGFTGWEHGLFSQAWHVAHKAAHLAAFPALDAGSVRNLDEAIAARIRFDRKGVSS